MNEADAIELLRDGIMVTLKISAPILLVGMIVGLIVSIVQTTTSIQEQTLTFVPKILAIFITIIVFASWFIQTMIDFTKELLSKIATL